MTGPFPVREERDSAVDFASMSLLPVVDVEEQVIPAIVERIVRELKPLRIILFGSYARGQAERGSDVDLLVVLDYVDDRREVQGAIESALEGLDAPKDVIVVTPDEIARRGRVIGTVLEPALREGRVLYRRSDDAGAAMSQEVSLEERLGATRHWLRLARRDLASARTLASAAEPDPAGACFFAQQAAEKMLESAALWSGLEAPRTHNLDQLRDLLPGEWSAKSAFPHLLHLSRWAAHGRYPGPWPEPTDADAREAITDATAIQSAIAADLSARGLPAEEPSA